jgi:4-hydroxybenzoate polyprenyltransferase
VATPAAAIARRTGTAALIDALRPRQWTKNVFVFAGLVFGGRLFDRASILRELGAFAIFCAASSAVYLANDAADRELDARHPVKRARPVASGRLPVPVALAVCAALSAGALAASAALSRGLLWIVLGYLAMSFAYSAGLKRVFLVDVMIVAFGFVLRAAAGAAVLGVEISPWLLCCSFLLALFLALGKRRAELALLGDGASGHRATLEQYTVSLVDRWVTALSGATIVSYALYTQSPRTVEHFGTTNLLYTLPFVVYALFRYQQLVTRDGTGGDPGLVLAHSPGLLVALLGWAATAAIGSPPLAGGAFHHPHGWRLLLC